MNSYCSWYNTVLSVALMTNIVIYSQAIDRQSIKPR